MAEPLTTIAKGLQVVQGIGGLFGGKGGRRKRNQQMSAAERARELQLQGFQEAMGLARRYDPAKETEEAARFANQLAAKQFGDEAERLNARFAAGGGSAGGDTLFRTQLDQRAAAISDPVKAMVVDARSRATMGKLQALLGALAMGGDVARGYQELAQQNQTNAGSSIALLGAGLDGLLGQATKKKKPSGNGDDKMKFANNLYQGFLGFGIGSR